MKNLNDFKQSLISLAYQLYPYNLKDDGSPEYRLSVEHQRLLERRKDIGQYNKRWNILLTKVREYCSEESYEIENWIETVPIDHCFIFKLIIRRENIPPETLTINISYVTKLFSIYQNINGQPLFVISPKLLGLHDRICAFINEVFPEYMILPPELCKVELHHICYNSIGMTYNEQSSILKKLTLFNAFFSTTYH